MRGRGKEGEEEMEERKDGEREEGGSRDGGIRDYLTGAAVQVTTDPV